MKLIGVVAPSFNQEENVRARVNRRTLGPIRSGPITLIQAPGDAAIGN